MGFGRGGGGGRGRGRFGAPPEESAPIPKERRARTVRRIVVFFRPYRLQIAVVVVAILATSLLGLINPLLLGVLVDQVIVGKDYSHLNLYVGLMIVIPIVTGLIGVGQAYLNNIVGQSVMQDLRNALYAHLQRMPLRFFTETRTGEIQSRLANDVGGIQAVVTDTAANLTSNIAVASSTIIAMFLISWQLTLLSLAVTPFFMYLTFRVGKVRRTVSTETQKSLAEMSAATEETLSVSGMLLSKTFGQQAASITRFRDLNKRLAALQIRQAMVGRWFFMIIGVGLQHHPGVRLLAGGDAGDERRPDRADGRPDRGLHDPPEPALLPARLAAQRPGRDPGLAGAVRPDLRVPRPRPGDPRRARCHGSRPGDGPRQGPPARGVVPLPERGRPGGRGADRRRGRARGHGRLARARRRGRPGRRRRRVGAGPQLEVPELRIVPGFALEGIDFEAEPGELVALVGPSGSGKTTTTYLIPRLYDVDEGAVEIDDLDVRRVTLESLGRVIGFVTQETYLFHSSIRDNLQYAKPDASEAELEAAATAAAIHDRIVELPDGYDTIVGERGYKLSGGEKQRIAIARVLLKDPRILILDEATSALDTVSERLIQAALERLMEGRTTIAIAHRLSTILRADRILVYERGHIVERGTHAELLAQGGLYARLYREQFETAGPELVATMTTIRTATLRHEGGMRFATLTGTGREPVFGDLAAGRRAEPDGDRGGGARGVQRDGRRVDRAQEAPVVHPLRGPGPGRPARRVPAGDQRGATSPTRSRGPASASPRSAAASSCRPRSTARSTRCCRPGRPWSITSTM